MLLSFEIRAQVPSLPLNRISHLENTPRLVCSMLRVTRSSHRHPLSRKSASGDPLRQPASSHSATEYRLKSMPTSAKPLRTCRASRPIHPTIVQVPVGNHWLGDTLLHSTTC